VGRVRGNHVLTAAALLLLLAGDAAAQYFGRNKVQYDRDDTRVLATDHFDVYYSSGDAASAQLAARLAERWYARLSAVFDHSLRGRQPLVLYGSHRRFEQTNIYRGLIDESTGGFTDARKRRIVLPFAASLAETDHVLGHEIVHAFQFDLADQSRSSLALPLWFIEGMAEYLTLGPDDQQTAMWMRDAVASGPLPAIRDLSSPRYFPYRWGAAVWAHLVAHYGKDLPARALRAKHDLKRRLQALTGQSLEELSRDWHRALRDRYGERGTGRPSVAPLIAGRPDGGRLNLAASLSPDGRRMIFLSERDQFSIDLFLAEAETGRVIRKLLTTAGNAAFESLQYLHSAGEWDPTGSRFALATITQGRPALLILEIDGRRTRRELAVPQVDEIYSPTWSPDGTAIVFSAMKSGVSDLFRIDLADGLVRQLTNDPFADLQPAWSPDGRTIAFTTDRFTTRLARLAFGTYRIGLLDLASATIADVPALAGVNHLDPAWAPDGAQLYFVGDLGGVNNVFRVELDDGAVRQVTDVETGVSGATRVSPVLSVASASGAVAYGVFRRGGYEVHRVAGEVQLAGASVDPTRLDAGARQSDGTDNGEIAPVPPLPAMPAVPRGAHTRYSPTLSLEGIGSPYLSAGGGPIGGYVAGGASLLFGDLLGDHQLLTALYLSSRLDESAVGALYVNRVSRWSWGVSLEQTPDVRLRTHATFLNPDRDRVVTRERDRLLWTNRYLGGFAAYPLNRSLRVEVNTGIRQLAFERERVTELVSLASGRILEHQSQPLPAEPSVGLADAGVSLVGDTALFGGTGPMLGTRYRFQAVTTVGGLKYTSILADYRRYFMPVRPYTVALRLVHSGRYGADAADFRLRDAYLGSPTLVRGYGAGSVARAECRSGSGECPALNALIANRFVALKIELRVPVLSALTSSSRIRYGPVPLDAFVFADAGAGWGGELRFGPRDEAGRIVRSAGAGLRMNVIGLVFEASAVRPFDLARGGWTFGFTLRPGF
jgi:hypothetical protein